MKFERLQPEQRSQHLSTPVVVYELAAATPGHSVYYTTRFRHWVIVFCSANLVCIRLQAGLTGSSELLT